MEGRSGEGTAGVWVMTSPEVPGRAGGPAARRHRYPRGTEYGAELIGRARPGNHSRLRTAPTGPLARLEAGVALNALLQRFPRMPLAVDEAELTWRPNVLIHGLTALPVQLG
jgi:hypothetical protein